MNVDTLAQIIRRVDGDNTMGAGELAEAIVAALDLTGDMIDENGCFTAPNGDCISESSCIHSPQPAQPDLEVVGWQHTLNMDGGETAVRLARAEIDRPWGKPGIDFDDSFSIDIEPLVRLTDAQDYIAALTEKVEELTRERDADRMRFPMQQADLRNFMGKAENAEARVVMLEEALDQLLDDMGTDGLSVCQAAKDQARAAMGEVE